MKYTIIVVNYNKEKYLKRCLESIINQTYKNFELIIVDDGSTDNSRKIINEYKKFSNVKIYFKQNTGVADTRNFGISKVKTKYFTFVDSDDYIKLDLIETISKYNNYDILSFNNYRVHEKSLKKIRIEDPSKGNFTLNGENTLINYIKVKTLFLVPWGYIYNINLFKNNNFKYTKNLVHEDTLLTPILLFNSKKIITIDYYGYYYVLSKESIIRTKNSAKIDLKIKSMLYTYKYLKNYFNSNISDKERKKLINNYFTSILIYFGNELTYKKKKEFSYKLKQLKIYKEIEITDLFSKIKYNICKKDFMIYYNFYNILNYWYWKIRKLYYWIIKHEKI